MSVAEAADKLHVSERQVRRLAADGELASHMVGRHRLIDAAAVRERARSRPRSGRPLSPEMAWAVLAAVASRLDDHEGIDPFSKVGDRRARHRLRNLLLHAPPVGEWGHWLRRRAQPLRAWAHPGVVERLASDPRVRRGEGGAAAAAGIGVAGGDRRVLYVSSDHLEPLMAEFRAHEVASGQIVLMVVPVAAADAVMGIGGEAAVLAAGLVDLLASPDARERHGAEVALTGALARLLETPPSAS